MKNFKNSMDSVFDSKIINPEESEKIDGFVKLLFSGAKPTEILAYANDHKISFMEYDSLKGFNTMMRETHERVVDLSSANSQLKKELGAILQAFAGTVRVVQPLLEDMTEEAKGAEKMKLNLFGQFLMRGSSFFLKDDKFSKEELRDTILKVQKLVPYLMTNMEVIIGNFAKIDWAAAIEVLVERKVVPKELFSKEIKNLPSGENTENNG